MKIAKTAAVLSGLILMAGLNAPAHADTAAPQGANQTQSLGACVWNHVSDTDKAAIAAIYHQASQDDIVKHLSDISAVVQARQDALGAAYKACDATPDVLTTWAAAVLADDMLLTGAATELKASRGIDSAALDKAWSDAPADSRRCAFAISGRALDSTLAACPDQKTSMGWFLTRFGLSATDQAHRKDAEQVFMYAYAKSQLILAQAMIGHFEGGPTMQSVLGADMPASQ